jgi:hypothetical protein
MHATVDVFGILLKGPLGQRLGGVERNGGEFARGLQLQSAGIEDRVDLLV